MAEIRLQPPEPFNFRNPDDWPRWKRRFQQFREASGLDESAETKQVSTFLYCLGEESEAVLTSTNATSEERKEYKKVVEKFDSYFQVRKNVIFERARFNKRKQQSGETAEEYIMVLYDLAECCDYGDTKEAMIRDRLVAGIRDHALSEKLQTDSKLTLDTAKKTIRQKEAVHEQEQRMQRLLASTRSFTSDRIFAVILAAEATDKRKEDSPRPERSVAAVDENAIREISALQKMRSATAVNA